MTQCTAELRCCTLCSECSVSFRIDNSMQEGVRPASLLLRMLEQAIPAAPEQQGPHTCPTVALAYCAFQLAYSIPRVDHAMLQHGTRDTALHACAGQAALSLCCATCRAGRIKLPTLASAVLRK